MKRIGTSYGGYNENQIEGQFRELKPGYIKAYKELIGCEPDPVWYQDGRIFISPKKSMKVTKFTERLRWLEDGVKMLGSRTYAKNKTKRLRKFFIKCWSADLSKIVQGSMEVHLDSVIHAHNKAMLIYFYKIVKALNSRRGNEDEIAKAIRNEIRKLHRY